MKAAQVAGGVAWALLIAGCDAPRPRDGAAATPQDQAATPRDAERLPPPGAAWTRRRQPKASFIAPPENMDADGRLAFFTGFSFFRSPWIAAPASTTARDGLGPLFNAHTCAACHPNGGRGASLLDNPDAPGTVVRLSVLDGEGALRPHPKYGNQLQTRATYPGGAEATVRATATTTADNLRRLAFDVRLAGNGSDSEHAPSALRFSARMAPPLLGLGLLEAIPEASLLARADAEDADGDGISGRPQRLPSGRIGRFGWKAMRATVAEQTAAAFSEDIGITSTRFPHSACTPRQTECRRQPHGADAPEGVEIPTQLFDYVAHFVAHIPPPAAGRLTPRVRRGRRTFAAVGCAGCHTPSHRTPAGVVWPYTDLLLHDMGEGLADHRPEGEASGREWRTAPLWGVGARVGGAGRVLLHDGRARNVDEAIRWHGGEAAAAQRAYRRLREDSRRDLLAFLNAI